MNAVDMAKRAYGANAAPVRTPRNTEYAVFAQVTQSMHKAAAAGTSDFAALAQALHTNRKLWRTLVIDVVDKDNGLPDALRARIVYLYNFVNLHSSKVLKGEGTIGALVDINTSIMRGLAQEGQPK